MRFEPMVTTRPPSRSGSTFVESLTVRPSRAVSQLRIGKCMGAGDFGRHFAALRGSDRAEGADHLGQFGKSAVLRQHAEEILRQLGHAEDRGNTPQGLLRIAAANLGIGGDGGELARFGESGLELAEIRFDRSHGSVFAGEIEQGRSVTPCQASLNTGGNIHASVVL